MEMKICYLILAHDNFEHLNRLIEALNDAKSTFYIHIDKKTEQTYVATLDNVKVIPTHLNIHWGSFTMVEATLALMEYAVKYSSDADYYILISGVDYPIRSKKFLYDLLEKKKEYIDIASAPVVHKPMERYEYYYFGCDRRNFKYYNPKFLLESVLKKFGIKRKAPFRIYAGSQWFAITNKCVKYVLDTIKEDDRYVSFFRYSHIPDESFFQTIIGNSTFLEQTTANLTYTDWEVPVPPSIIENRHIDFLKTHNEFNDEFGQRFPYFARKFNDNSKEIIGRIQNELWK